MDIFINSKKMGINIKNNKLITILERVEKEFLEDGEIIVELLLDGKKVDPTALPFNKKVKILELKTKTHRDILIESLYMFENFSDRFYESYMELKENPKDTVKLYELGNFIEWCLGIILSLKEATKLDMIYRDFDEYIEDFRRNTSDLILFLKKEKYVEIMEILDKELIGLVEDLRLNCKDYLEQILEEEGRKKFLN